MPCIPNTATPWIGGKLRVRICGEPTILDNSKVMCMWAGVIEVTNPGQNFVKEGAASVPGANVASVTSEEKAKEAAVEAGEPVEDEEVDKLKVKDFVEILEKIEAKQGYEAARYFASNRIDYWKINKLAKRFVKGTDEEREDEEKEKNNDPALMPSRFMILYGADDEKLRGRGNIDKHPDNFDGQPDHEMSVEKLREALILFGNDVEKTGPFDDKVYFAFLKYIGQFGRIDLSRNFSDDEKEDDRLDRFADEHGLFSWKYFEDDGNRDKDHAGVIEELNPEYGDGLLADKLSEKGVKPDAYMPGACYQYPWGPFRLTVKLGEEYKDKTVEYQLFGRESGVLLAEGEIEDPFKIERLMPDAGELVIEVDGMEMEWRHDYGGEDEEAEEGAEGNSRG